MRMTTPHRRARWRQPCLSVVSLDTSNEERSFSVIPHSAVAKVRPHCHCWVPCYGVLCILIVIPCTVGLIR